MHGMYGTLDAKLEVQRTTKRGELTAYLCLLSKAIGPTMVHGVNKGTVDGLWRAAKDADLWIFCFGRSCTEFTSKSIVLVEVERVKAHHTKKEMQYVSLLRKVHRGRQCES